MDAQLRWQSPVLQEQMIADAIARSGGQLEALAP
jgi:hypothetical protein